MHLIFGGSYQGKLEYAMKLYKLAENDIYSCIFNKGNILNANLSNVDFPMIDFSKKVIYHLEDYIRTCQFVKIEAKDHLAAHKEDWQDKIIICTDISSGIVPYEEELRAWREMVGRTLVYLGKEAEEVTRVFCGIPQKLK